MNDLDKKISQAVYLGSPYLALDKGFFTAKELLEWLPKVPVDIYSKIAYKALCDKIPMNQQYLEDSYHILVKKPSYLLLNDVQTIDLDINDRKESPSIPLIYHITSEMNSLRNRPDVEIYQLINYGRGHPDYLRDNLDLCCKVRQFPFIKNVTGHGYNIALVEADWIDKFRINETLIFLILSRMTQLKLKVPDYYNFVVKHYRNVAVKLYTDKLLYKLNKDNLLVFNEHFPKIIDNDILSFSDLAYNIYLQSNELAGYLLGFPIQSQIPSDKQIKEACSFLNTVGVDNYLSHIKAYIKSICQVKIPFSSENEVFSNDKDVLMEQVDDYSPFDIVSCRIGSYTYRFTRPEFKQILESKKNVWTNEWLSPSIICSINSRIETAKILGLPKSDTLKELLRKCEVDELFKEEEEEQYDMPDLDPNQIERIDNVATLIVNAMFGIVSNNSNNIDMDTTVNENYSEEMRNVD